MFRLFAETAGALPGADCINFRSSILFLFLAFWTYCYVKKQLVYRVRETVIFRYHLILTD
jgi:hypothetical protein